MSDRPRVGRGTIVAGALLILLGVAWLLQAVGVGIPWGAALPAALIVVGVTLIVTARSGGRHRPVPPEPPSAAREGPPHTSAGRRLLLVTTGRARTPP